MRAAFSWQLISRPLLSQNSSSTVEDVAGRGPAATSPCPAEWQPAPQSAGTTFLPARVARSPHEIQLVTPPKHVEAAGRSLFRPEALRDYQSPPPRCESLRRMCRSALSCGLASYGCSRYFGQLSAT